MSLETNLSIFLVENRLIRDFLYLEMYNAHDQAKAVQGDPAKAQDLIQFVQLLQDVVGLFRDNTCIIDALNVLNRINEFFTDDFPMILTFENMYREILDVIYSYKCQNRLLGPPVPVYGPLPVISELTKFDGRLIEWRYFHINFITYVHSKENLKHEVRFNYLLSLLSGDALQIVQSFPPFAENYVAAWTTLQYHFENTFVLGLSYLETIYKSEEPCPDLQTFANVFKDNIAQLQAIWRGDLKRIIEFYSSSRLSLSSMLFNNVEPRSRRLNLKLLEDFVNQGCKIVENNDRTQNVTDTSESSTDVVRRAYPANGRRPTTTASLSTPSTSFTPSSSFTPSTGLTPSTSSTAPTRTMSCISPSSNRCLYCYKSQHTLYECVAFRNLTPRKRKQFISRRKLCFLCLSSSH